MSIEKTEISLSAALQNTGIIFYDYKLNGQLEDYQDLAVIISKQRAMAVEKEITPLSSKMRTRNNKIDKAGKSLSEFTGIQAQFKSDQAGSETKPITAAQVAAYKEVIGKDPAGYNSSNMTITKAGCAESVQLLKSTLDTLNNEAQTDMNRLQDLVTKRDDSFTNATDILSTISGTRDTVLKSI